MGELYQKLKEYGQSDYCAYHMPGHKRTLFGDMPPELFQADITEIDGFDNLHQSEGILKELQEKAAALYGAEETFYLVNGSTCGILSAISAALPVGGHILMARNSHKSAYHACYLRNLTISYLYPPYLAEYDIYDGFCAKQVKEALAQEPDIGAVFLVSPTYEGRIAQIKEIAQVVHEKGIPLIVDEAHGAHLGLAENFPSNSCQLGADIVIHSVHKTLPAMTQTALLHVNGNLINRSNLKRFLHIYQSSSPSYILMASIDNGLELVAKRGKELFADFRENYRHMLQNLKACRYLRFVPLEEERQDIGKLVISAKGTKLSGQQIFDMLLEHYHLQPEMAAGSYCLAMFTVGDGKEAYERMEKALLEIDKFCDVCERAQVQIPPYSSESRALQSDAIPLARAWDMEWEQVPLSCAIGRRTAEFINLYPPGVPLLVPGETMEHIHFEMLTAYREQGLNIQGVEKEPPFYVKVLL